MAAKVSVSVVCSTWRPGGIDVLFEGLVRQNYIDFELILVDHRYERRHRQVMDYASSLGLNVIHVPEYKRNGKWNVLTAGWNTGFMLAEGEIIIMLVDYAYTPPNWIETHVKHHNNGKQYAMGPHEYVTLPKVKLPFEEISIFEQRFKPEILDSLKVFQPPHQDPKLTMGTRGVGYTYVHMKNESFLREVVYDVNGCDENFDKGKGPSDNEFGYRFMHAGCSIQLDQEAKVMCLNPRFILPTMPWGKMEESVEGRWSYRDGERYQNSRYAEIANGAPPVAKNSYSLREKRKELLRWRTLPKIYTSALDIDPTRSKLCSKCDIGLIEPADIPDFLESNKLPTEIFSCVDLDAVIGMCPKCNCMELRKEMI